MRFYFLPLHTSIIWHYPALCESIGTSIFVIANYELETLVLCPVVSHSLDLWSFMVQSLGPAPASPGAPSCSLTGLFQSLAEAAALGIAEHVSVFLIIW